MAVKLPRLLDSKGNFIRLINPISVSISEKITPLSIASIELDKGENLPARGFVELYTPYGSAGVYRVRSPHDAYGDDITTAELEHAIAEVGDYLVKEKIDGMVAASTAMQRVFKHYGGTHWKLGSVSALGSAAVAVQANYVRVLDAMLAILQQKPKCMLQFDFTSMPWVVSVVARGTTVTAEGRLSRNVSSAAITYDDTELCTRAYYETYPKDKNGKPQTGKDGNQLIVWKYKDADTIKTYGRVEREVVTSSDMTDAEVNAVVNTYLEEHKAPRITVDIDAEELSQITGESLDKFTIGKLFRLAIPEYNVTIEKNITGLEWGDVYGDQRALRVLLADEEDTIVNFLHDLDAKGGGGGGGGGQKKEEEKWKEYFTKITQTDYYIDMYAARVDRANQILEKAGLELNSKGVLIYAQDKANQIASKIKAQADRISLVVTDGKRPKIRAGEITLAINQDKSIAKIVADRIELTGFVTAKQLNTVDARISSLASGNTTATMLKSTLLSASTGFNYQGSAVQWKTATIDGTEIHYLGN